MPAPAVIALVVLSAIIGLASFASDDALPIGLLLAGVPMALAIAWLFPVELALLFAALTMFRLHEAYPILMPLHLPLLSATLAILSCGLHLISRTVAIPDRLELRLALLFFAHVTLGTIYSTNVGNSLGLWPHSVVKLAIAMLFLAMILKLPRDAGKVAFVLVAGSSLISCVAIYNQLNGLELVEGTRVTIGRSAKSQLGDPNDLCFALMFPVAFALSALMVRGVKTFHRILWLIALILMSWAIIATKSRGGVLATVAVFGCIYAITFKAKLLPMLVAATIGGLLYVVAGIGQREYVMGTAGAIDESSMTRLDAWKSAIKMALDRPLFGVGIGNFPEQFWQYTEFWLGRVYVTHSIWFQALSETGFVGVGLFIAMFVAAIRSSYWSLRVLERADAPAPVRALGVSLFATWIGICVAGSFLSQIFGWQIFTLVALTAVLGKHVTDTYPEAGPAKAAGRTAPAARYASPASRHPTSGATPRPAP